MSPISGAIRFINEIVAALSECYVCIFHLSESIWTDLSDHYFRNWNERNLILYIPFGTRGEVLYLRMFPLHILELTVYATYSQYVTLIFYVCECSVLYFDLYVALRIFATMVQT